MIDSLIDWLIDWLIDQWFYRTTDWSIDWFIYRLILFFEIIHCLFLISTVLQRKISAPGCDHPPPPTPRNGFTPLVGSCLGVCPSSGGELSSGGVIRMRVFVCARLHDSYRQNSLLIQAPCHLSGSTRLTPPPPPTSTVYPFWMFPYYA